MRCSPSSELCGETNLVHVLLVSVQPDDSTLEAEALQEVFAGRHELTAFDPARPAAEQFTGVEAVIDIGGFASNDLIDAAADVKFWQIISTGTDHIDLDCLGSKGIVASNCPGSLTAAGMAETVMMLMLMLTHKFTEAQTSIEERILCMPIGHTLNGMTLGLVGFGASARALAKRAKAFDMRTEAVDIAEIPQAVVDKLQLDFLGTLEQVDGMVARSDVVSIHVPLTAQTHHFMDVRRIGLMKPSAYLINVARGGIVDDTALYDALIGGQLAGAAADVFEDEPIDPGHRLRKLPNFISTPHIAGQTYDTIRKRAVFALDNVDRVAKGMEPLSTI